MTDSDHVIETRRLFLRRWRESDREPFARMNADPRVMEFYPILISRQDSDATMDRIAAHFEQHGYGMCAAELRDSGAFAGYIGLSITAIETHFTPCVEIAWSLAPEFWGRGLATEGAAAALSYGFETLKLNEIVSFTAPANVRSRRVMEKIGMRYDPEGDFDHPQLPEGHPLRRHVLYRLTRAEAAQERIRG
jgi:RimJ/RimL family protein N-acetyltransferase